MSRVQPGLMKLDITDFEATEKYLRDVRPNFIAHCAAQRSPDKVDTEYEKTCRLNIEASGNLASLASMCNLFSLLSPLAWLCIWKMIFFFFPIYPCFQRKLEPR